MLKKNRLSAVTGLAVLMACSFACAQENVSKDSKKEKSQETQNVQKEIQPQVIAKDGALTQDEIQKVSEAFGHFIGRNLNTPGVKFDIDSIIKGMREGVAGKPAPMSDQEYEALMTKLQEQSFNALAEANLKAANDFLAKNSKESNVVVIVPGQLQYTILQAGDGIAVEENFTPLIQYTGKYIDGTVFGSSEETGSPISIPLNQTIPGFSKGILGMKEGEKRRLFVHPSLAYGTTGQLPPNSLLIFDIEVVKANAADKNAKDDNDLGFELEEDKLSIDSPESDLSLGDDLDLEVFADNVDLEPGPQEDLQPIDESSEDDLLDDDIDNLDDNNELNN